MNEKMPVQDDWDWKACVVCGSENIDVAGLIITIPEEKPPYLARIAWCAKDRCRDDRANTNFQAVTSEETIKIDAFLKKEVVE